MNLLCPDRPHPRPKLLLPLLLLLAVASPAFAQPTVRYVIVKTEGGPEIDPQSVTAFIKTRPGEPFARTQIGTDVRTLEQTGRFSNVGVEVATISPTEVDVYFVVRPSARLRRVIVRGGNYYGDRKIRKLMGLKRGELVDTSKLQSKVTELKAEYQEKYFPFVSIDSSIEHVPGTNNADVVLEIFEGPRSTVNSITFEGNEAVSSRRLLKVMTQKKRNLISFITRAGTYDPDNLDTDLLRIAREFQRLGYLDVKVNEPEIATDKEDRLDITIGIEQGQQYRIGRVELSGNELFQTQKILDAVRLKSGDIAGSLDIEAARQAVQDFYGTRGFISTRVAMRMISDPEEPLVHLHFAVREGPLATVREIFIRGNTRTEDKVIRRELTIFPGDVFDSVRIRNSVNRVRNLNYFSYVNRVVEETDKPNVYDLVFEVEEQKTGSFIAGAGISSVDDVIGFIELSQGNFSLLPLGTGAGQKVKLRLTLGTSRRDYELDFIEPYFLNRKLALGVGAFQHDRRFLSDDYDQRNTGGSISLGRPLGGYWRGSVRYTLEQVEVFNVDDDVSELIRAEEGKQLQSGVTLGLRRDSRNSSLLPSRGSLTRLSAGLSGGIFGFDTDIYQLEARHNHFFPMWFDHVLNLKGRIAVVDHYGDSDRVPIFDRLFSGGARTVRGFDFRDISPKDEEGESIGGNTLEYATAEYLIPIAPNLRFATFIDAAVVNADAFEFGFSDINSSYGVGIRLDLPGFPLQLDYSWQLESDPFNERNSGKFSFLIGTFF